MCSLDGLFANNRAWVNQRVDADPEFFTRLARQQSPKYLWIGCADSRVPANEILGLDPGEVFVHRNIANLVVHSDLNCLSVLQYAVEALKVEHIMVVGHYGCGGVQAVAEHRSVGLADNWLRHIEAMNGQAIAFRGPARKRAWQQTHDGAERILRWARRKLRLIDNETGPQPQPWTKRPQCDVDPGNDRLTQKMQKKPGELDRTQVPLLRGHQAQTCPGCHNGSNQPDRKIASIGAG